MSFKKNSTILKNGNHTKQSFVKTKTKEVHTKNVYSKLIQELRKEGVDATRFIVSNNHILLRYLDVDS